MIAPQPLVVSRWSFRRWVGVSVSIWHDVAPRSLDGDFLVNGVDFRGWDDSTGNVPLAALAIILTQVDRASPGCFAAGSRDNNWTQQLYQRHCCDTFHCLVDGSYPPYERCWKAWKRLLGDVTAWQPLSCTWSHCSLRLALTLSNNELDTGNHVIQPSYTESYDCRLTTVLKTWTLNLAVMKSPHTWMLLLVVFCCCFFLYSYLNLPSPVVFLEAGRPTQALANKTQRHGRNSRGRPTPTSIPPLPHPSASCRHLFPLNWSTRFSFTAYLSYMLWITIGKEHARVQNWEHYRSTPEQRL